MANSKYLQTGVWFDERMALYFNKFDPTYEEHPGRLRESWQRCVDYGLIARCKLFKPKPASKEDVQLQHTNELYELVKSSAQMSDEQLEETGKQYDGIYFHEKSYDSAMLSLGAVLEATEAVQQGKLRNAFALVRPPGHHATKEDVCGFCYFNNVAIAASRALERGAKRILIVDYDVHHGQATQYAFWDDPRVLYFSIHRYERGWFWPSLHESDYTFVGGPSARGFNINFPLNKKGMGDAEYISIFQNLLLPIAYEFDPELVIVSAGYDAAIGCPEGEMRVTPACYAHLIHALKGLAGGKIMVALEGGYCVKSLSESVALTLRELLGEPTPAIRVCDGPHTEVRSTLLDAIATHRAFWRSLCIAGWTEQSVQAPQIDNASNATVYSRFARAESSPLNVWSRAQLDAIHKDIDTLISNTSLQAAPVRCAFFYDDRMLQHKEAELEQAGGLMSLPHPESPARLLAVLQRLRTSGWLARTDVLHCASRFATRDELLQFHDGKYVAWLQQACKEKSDAELTEYARKNLDSVYLNRGSYEAALLAAGCLLEAVDTVVGGKARTAFCLVRPPGHHALMEAPKGFCMFNSVVLAAQHALARGLQRVLVLDWDVHHGNSTQQAFLSDNRVLYISVHRFGAFYPSFEPSSEQYGGMEVVGSGRGEGFNVNIPFSGARMGDPEFLAAFLHVVMPVAYEFAPELVLVSAGFDAARGDPLGNFDVSPQCFAQLTHMLSSLASGRLILALEGGYNRSVIAECSQACCDVLVGCPPPRFTELAPPRDVAVRTLCQVIDIQKRYWKSLCVRQNLDWVDWPNASVPLDEAKNRLVSVSDDACKWQLQSQDKDVRVDELIGQISQLRVASVD